MQDAARKEAAPHKSCKKHFFPVYLPLRIHSWYVVRHSGMPEKYTPRAYMGHYDKTGKNKLYVLIGLLYMQFAIKSILY